jgi:hypothetical protein
MYSKDLQETYQRHVQVLPLRCIFQRVVSQQLSSFIQDLAIHQHRDQRCWRINIEACITCFSVQTRQQCLQKRKRISVKNIQPLLCALSSQFPSIGYLGLGKCPNMFSNSSYHAAYPTPSSILMGRRLPNCGCGSSCLICYRSLLLLHRAFFGCSTSCRSRRALSILQISVRDCSTMTASCLRLCALEYGALLR